MRFQTNLKTTHNLVDLTPLVDVIFLLLIFFILTSDILPLKSLNIESPKLDKDAAPLTTQLVIVMDRQNVIYVGSKKTIVDLQSLKNQLLKDIEHLQKLYGKKEPTLVISVDKNIEYGEFLKVFSIAQECCSKLRLVFKPNEESDIF